jgi:thiazolylpeptide-type bacteriocin precursor
MLRFLLLLLSHIHVTGPYHPTIPPEGEMTTTIALGALDLSDLAFETVEIAMVRDAVALPETGASSGASSCDSSSCCASCSCCSVCST